MALTIAQSALALSADGSSATSFGPGPSITIGSGGNRALLFTFYGMVATASVASTPAPTITATFNGVNVPVFGYRYHTGDRSWLAHGYLPAPPSGAGTLSLTVSSGQFSMLAFVEERTDAHQTTTPVVVSGGTSTAAPPATLSGTTTTNGSDLVSAIAGGRRSGAPTSAISCTDGTLSITDQTGTTDLQSVVGALGYKSKPTAGADSITFTWTGTFRTVRQSVEVFEEIASGGGVSVTTGTGSVTVQGHAPTAGAGATAATGTGAVAVQGHAPTATAGATATPGTGALSVQGFAPTAGAGVSATPGTGSITVQGYAPTVSDGSVAETQPGGWLPIKYVDRDGNVVDLDAVEEAIEEIAEQAPPKRRADLTRVSARVLAMLARDETPRRDDVRLLRRALAEREAALMALNAALLAQQLLDDEITVLLLAA